MARACGFRVLVHPGAGFGSQEGVAIFGGGDEFVAPRCSGGCPILSEGKGGGHTRVRVDEPRASPTLRFAKNGARCHKGWPHPPRRPSTKRTCLTPRWWVHSPVRDIQRLRRGGVDQPVWRIRRRCDSIRVDDALPQKKQQDQTCPQAGLSRSDAHRVRPKAHQPQAAARLPQDQRMLTLDPSRTFGRGPTLIDRQLSHSPEPCGRRGCSAPAALREGWPFKTA